jgi:hypothetical protein
VEPTLWQQITGAWGLDRAAFEAAIQAPHGLRQSLIILLLAGIAETLGQSVVLILNRVSRRRFALALGLGGLALIFEAALWIAGVWLVVTLLAGPRASFLTSVKVIGMAYAPLILSIFVFLPYIGILISHLLRVWVLLAVVVGTSVAFELPPIYAALAAGLGYLARWAVLRLFSRVGGRLNSWLLRASTGQVAPVRSADALLTARGPEVGP